MMAISESTGGEVKTSVALPNQATDGARSRHWWPAISPAGGLRSTATRASKI